MQESTSDVLSCWPKYKLQVKLFHLYTFIIINYMVHRAVTRRKTKTPEVPRPPTSQGATLFPPTPSSCTGIEAATLSFKLEYPQAIPGIQHWQSPMFRSQAKRRQSLGPQRYTLRVEITTGGMAPEVWSHKALLKLMNSNEQQNHTGTSNEIRRHMRNASKTRNMFRQWGYKPPTQCIRRSSKLA